MAKKSARSASASKNKKKGEVQVAKSPAEFFAENQAIAGFDNLGKSLYTTIRELVENSLDACESVNVLPEVVVLIEDMTQKQFNDLSGIGRNNVRKDAIDEGLFQKGGCSGSKVATTKKSPPSSKTKSVSGSATGGSGNEPQKTEGNGTTSETKKRRGRPRTEEAYFRISVRDNGCGMVHESIPNLLGRVLSGSKYGVRQTRGKFGLGAKMALIWSKKSTGVPIKVKTAHRIDISSPPPFVSKCVLDIDIYKNEPKIIEHKKYSNEENFVGTEFEVLIAGNWITYKARIVQYLQQLAIITPYAKLEMRYTNMSDSKKDVTIRYDRRSEQMPHPAREVKHHPSSVNNLIMEQLLEQSNSKTFLEFLTKDLSGISPSVAKRVIAELGSSSQFYESMPLSSINGTKTVELVQVLRSVQLFKTPDGSCLSPLGEYNLNLGIRKVIEPDIVATARDKTSAHEGHPFLVEAAVSLGGKDAKVGISVLRFANRIPLLFEGGADVVTRVAQSKIKWSSYKIDHKKDKIGVFVSIVSTKVPFKGTGKEFISDEITEIQQSVKRSLQSCCQQLRSHLSKRNALRDIRERRSRLVKYVPDVTRSLMGLLQTMRDRRTAKTTNEDIDTDDDEGEIDEPSSSKKRPLKDTYSGIETIDILSSKRQRQHDMMEKQVSVLLEKVDAKVLTEGSLRVNLMDAIEKQNRITDGNDYVSSIDDSGGGGRGGGQAPNREIPQPVYLVPIYNNLDESAVDIIHPLFYFRPLKPITLQALDIES